MLRTVSFAALALSISATAPCAESADPPFQPKLLKQPVLRANPNRAVPLAAIVEFIADRKVTVSAEIRDGKATRRITFAGPALQKHRLVLLGFKPARTHSIQLTLHDGKGNAVKAGKALSFTTGRLPADFPPITCPISKPDKMEPGVTMFNCFQWINDVANEGLGYIIAVDSAGEVVWYCRTDHPISDVKKLKNGDLVYLRQHRVRPWTEAVRIDMLGNVVRDWYAAARVEPGTGPANAIPLAVDTLHHDVIETGGGNLRAITTEVRRLARYPTSDSLRSAPLRPANVVGDVIVEFQPNGKIVKRWHLHDLLDTSRVGHGSCSRFWDTRCYKAYRANGGTRDWSHANGLSIDPKTGAMIVSVRHQDAIFKIDPKTDKVAWILANPSGWSAPFRKLLLKPQGTVLWPYHQHSPKITSQGTLLVYDNGNYRAPGFRRPRPASRNRTRVVEYAIDEKNRTVKQIWEYHGDKPYLCPLFGDVDRLKKTGNIMITDGGMITDRRNRRTYQIPGDRQWARIVELDRKSSNAKVFELHIGSDKGGRFGWSVYRSERLPSLSVGATVPAGSK